MDRVAIRSLGAFAVLRGPSPLPFSAWQSKKARDLLKILVCRRGRPATRDALMEALWPGQDPRLTSNRLSVALSTVRGVLDPERRLPPGHFVDADRFCARLDLEHVRVDLELFLADAHRGLSRFREGRLAAALAPLRRAEAAYAGDFLEEDLYEDWAVSLREEARATYLAAASALAGLADARGDHDEAIAQRARALARDPYDERAHLALIASFVAAGRHGDAHRCYERYAARMQELGVEQAPFPAAQR